MVLVMLCAVLGTVLGAGCSGASSSRASAPSAATGPNRSDKAASSADPSAQVALTGAAMSDGKYVEPHVVMVVCENPDWCEEEANDVLTVKHLPGEAIAVGIELIQANAHMCTFEGTLAASGPGTWSWTEPNADEDPCTVTLSVVADAIVVDSEGCRAYCGARASLMARFPLSSLESAAPPTLEPDP